MIVHSCHIVLKLEFPIETDHKLLVPLLGCIDNSKPPASIQILCLPDEIQLQNPSKKLYTVDALSRVTSGNTLTHQNRELVCSCHYELPTCNT